MNGATSTLHSSAAAETGQQPVRVWDMPTRVFHWSLVTAFAGAWISAESERWRDVHVVFGYTLAGLIAFRLVWGLVGSRYARFSSFVFPPSRVVGYLKSLFSGTPEHHAGHNPAGALAILGLLVLGITLSASGYATYQELGGEWVEELHEGVANAMLGLVFIHLAGVVVSSFLHKENLIRAMITGWKPGRVSEGIPNAYPLIGITLLIAVLGFWGYSQTTAGRDFIASPSFFASGPGGTAQAQPGDGGRLGNRDQYGNRGRNERGDQRKRRESDDD